MTWQAPEDRPVHLARNLGRFGTTIVDVGAMIGAGVFVSTGIAAGPALIVAFGAQQRRDLSDHDGARRVGLGDSREVQVAVSCRVSCVSL